MYDKPQSRKIAFYMKIKTKTLFVYFLALTPAYSSFLFYIGHFGVYSMDLIMNGL